MKNIESWKPSKWKLEDGKLVCSDDKKEISYSSWLGAQLVADVYSTVIPKYAKGKLLDVGCGKFPLYGLYRNYVDECIGIDWENTLHNNTNVDFYLDISKPLPFESESFDTILSSDVLEHIYNPIDALNEMVRILKPGGFLLVNTPFEYWMHETPFDYYRYTEFLYRRYASENGQIECVNVEKIGSGLDVIGDTIGKIIGNKKRSQKIQKWFYKFRLTKRGKSISKKSSHMAIAFLAVYQKVTDSHI